MPLGRKHPLDGRIIKTVGGLGGGEMAPTYDRYGVTPPTNIPQLYLEPILRQIAERRNPARVLFHHELISFTETADGVEARIRNRDTGEEFPVTARYLIGRSEEHTSELQSLMRISYAVFCLKKKNSTQ